MFSLIVHVNTLYVLQIACKYEYVWEWIDSLIISTNVPYSHSSKQTRIDDKVPLFTHILFHLNHWSSPWFINFHVTTIQKTIVQELYNSNENKKQSKMWRKKRK